MCLARLAKHAVEAADATKKREATAAKKKTANDITARLTDTTKYTGVVWIIFTLDISAANVEMRIIAQYCLHIYVQGTIATAVHYGTYKCGCPAWFLLF